MHGTNMNKKKTDDNIKYDKNALPMQNYFGWYKLDERGGYIFHQFSNMDTF